MNMIVPWFKTEVGVDDWNGIWIHSFHSLFNYISYFYCIQYISFSFHKKIYTFHFLAIRCSHKSANLNLKINSRYNPFQVQIAVLRDWRRCYTATGCCKCAVKPICDPPHLSRISAKWQSDSASVLHWCSTTWQLPRLPGRGVLYGQGAHLTRNAQRSVGKGRT